MNLSAALLLLISIASLLRGPNTCCHAFTSRALIQQIENTQATLSVEVGQIPGTSTNEWGGAKLGFILEVGFTNVKNETQQLDGDALMGNKLQQVLPLNQPSFINASGTQIIDVNPGCYGCSIQDKDSEQCALRWYLDFPNGAKRNDVELPAERIYFLSKCWNQPSNDESMYKLERARIRKKQILSDIELTEARFNKIRNSPPAGNIFADVIQNAFNFRHIAVLISRKKRLEMELNDIEKSFPLDSDKVILGPNNIMYAKEGVIALKRSRKYLFVGTFNINELL